VAIGATISVLAAGPFIVKYFRKPTQLPEGDNANNYTKEYHYYLQRVSFPREYKEFQFHPLLPPDKKETVLRIHRRYWQNFTRIDEVEFDYQSRTILDGKVDNNIWSMDAHVYVKYGYGMEIKGKNVEGKPIHFYFNMKGEVTPEVRGQSDLTSMIYSFFSSCQARPELLHWYIDILEEGVKLPDNPYLKGHGLYDVLQLDGGKNKEILYYYSQETGMFEMRIDRKMTGSALRYQCLEYVPVSGVCLPTREESYNLDRNAKFINKYANFKVKLVD
jgi:hypothetical protein